MKKIIFDVESGDLIERDMTDEEISLKLMDEEADRLEKAYFQELANKKRAILDKLGLTEDEAKALLS